MLRIIDLLLVAASSVLAQRVTPVGLPFQGQPIPTLDKGHLIYINHATYMEVYDREGFRMFQADIRNAVGLPVVRVLSAAIDNEESVVATVMVTLPQGGRGGVLVWFDRSGKQAHTTQTGSFIPVQVCFDQNNELWVFGSDESDRAPNEKEYSPIRKYSRSGNEEGRFLSRSTFPGWAPPFDIVNGFRRVQAARDRIGALLYPGHAGLQPQWIEIDLQGKLLGRWIVGKHDGGLAYTEEGRLFKKTWGSKPPAPQLAELERSSGKWLSVEYPAEIPGQHFREGLLLGADRNQLVFSDQSAGQLLWVDAR